MEAFDILGSIFTECWRIWNIEFSFAGFTFTLANVAEVAVFVFVLGVLLDALLQGGWGAD